MHLNFLKCQGIPLTGAKSCRDAALCIYFNKLKPRLFFPGVSFGFSFLSPSFSALGKMSDVICGDISAHSSQLWSRMSYDTFTCFSVSMFLCMCNPKRQKRKMIQSLPCNQTTMPKQNQIKMNTFNYKTWWCITYLCVCCCCCCGITELLRSLWQTLNSSTGEGLAFICRWVELHRLRAQRSWICARGETGGRKQDLCERETTTWTPCLQH